ncbi:chorismate mutase 2 isoform X1 [Olea europaea var. sylvestris]|uniref:Chorismate mutase n=2 Tax=Olea europaea subsp. europaea TaxID=158383 RepID=A0A8S0S782_OLEEU|nr:chorismate mutase 2 isoform X1 [Olea europaea var. sylvestris]CAA2987106.1 chorismate mutase 2 isoform X2 [Olea europaea subsp. europaea]
MAAKFLCLFFVVTFSWGFVGFSAAIGNTSVFKHVSEMGNFSDDMLNLDTLRKILVREEDTIIFSLIERAKYPINSPLYDKRPGLSGSLFEFFVKESEAVQAKAGRYSSAEENAFFPDNLPPPLLPLRDNEQVLHPRGASININEQISNMYHKQLLPLITSNGDDRNYAITAGRDLDCLQALSRRIHLGKFVAEIKFRESPENYTRAIRAQDKDALMKLLTFTSVEEMIKNRVEKKAMVFGQEVDLKENDNVGKYKVNPSVVSRLYGEWVIPLTKFVEVEYLLCRLD